MRICMITSGHNPYDDRIYYKEILSLKKNFSDIYIVAPYDKDCITKESIQIKCFKREVGIIGRIKNLRNMYKRAIELKCDVYHAHEPDSLLVAYLLKRKLGVKVIYDSHEYHPEAFSEHFKFGKNFVTKIVYKYEKFICTRIDAIISVNDLLINKFKKFNDESVLIPNYPVKDNEAVKEYNEKPTFVYVGGLREDRGILKVIEAIYMTKQDYKYYFIGPFETNEFKNKVKKLIDSKNEKRDIYFTGRISHIKVFDYLKRAHVGFVLLQPTNWRYINSEPIKLFEYMISNTAIIASDFPMMRNIVETAQCGLITKPTSSESIKEAIEQLGNNLHETENMGLNGKNAVLKFYNWSICEKRLLKLYDKFL
ncbi:glycosyltransferase family 4 protein [Clostridium niameyense]|uniref:Glycosyltransferase family 4 protein n=1 Tax=Clostridium niameyense TaxID=1622073 RepID=A0A6M0R8M8_9CLOT|nr:glycosyltransferase family 4 protein [Clostridium niameyense]NEZ45598.1 glycosyltransferase family 4 protein [Clostridium niameyense]